MDAKRRPRWRRPPRSEQGHQHPQSNRQRPPVASWRRRARCPTPHRGRASTAVRARRWRVSPAVVERIGPGSMRRAPRSTSTAPRWRPRGAAWSAWSRRWVSAKPHARHHFAHQRHRHRRRDRPNAARPDGIRRRSGHDGTGTSGDPVGPESAVATCGFERWHGSAGGAERAVRRGAQQWRPPRHRPRTASHVCRRPRLSSRRPRRWGTAENAGTVRLIGRPCSSVADGRWRERIMLEKETSWPLSPSS